MSLARVSDPALLFRIAAGERGALLALYDRYAPVLLALAEHVVGVGHDAEEAVHDVFVHVWRHAADYRPRDGTVRAWLILQTRRQALDLLLDVPEILDQIGPSEFAVPAAPAVPPPRLHNERLRALRGLARLSHSDRQFLALIYFTGHSQQDIAARLALSPQRLQTKLTTALVRLRQALHLAPGAA